MAVPVLDSEDHSVLVQLPTSRLDSRSDAEIADLLRIYHPVTSEKNVWAFWDNSYDAMYPWCRRNVLGWVRRLGPSWTVRVLNAVPGSPNHFHNFVGPEHFPTAFNQGKLTGRNKGQHLSDLVRLAVLYQLDFACLSGRLFDPWAQAGLHSFGGVYMDVSTILIRALDDICWRSIEDPLSPYEVACFAFQSRTYFGQIFNAFIATRKSNPFIKRWKEIFAEMWKDRTDVQDIHQHALVRHLGLMTPDDPSFGDNPPLEDFTDYVAQVLAMERLRLLREPGPEGFDGSAYFRKHFFLLEGWHEAFRGQDVISGDTSFKLLAMQRRPGDFQTEEQVMARSFVHDMLARSCVAKFGQGYWMPGMPLSLSSYWAMREYADADLVEGTWWEFLRWGSLNLEQKRERGKCLTPIEIPEEKDVVVEAGYLEPVENK
ncbi:MAG: hypothetical protein M1812_003038 [Candelaria pacifica]|nr:MAG: hypothetical protein M1812_003038 [Candelaria pacifica]